MRRGEEVTIMDPVDETIYRGPAKAVLELLTQTWATIMSPSGPVTGVVVRDDQ